MRLLLTVPAGNDRGPQYMDHALAAIHQANPERLPLHLEIRRRAGEVTLALSAADDLRPVIESQLFAQYPECEIIPLGNGNDRNEGMQTWERRVHLHRDLFPIRRYSQFEDALNRVSADPLTALFMAIGHDRGKDAAVAGITMTLTPAARGARRRAEKCLRRLAGPFFRKHHRLSHVYCSLTLSRTRMLRMAGWLLGRLEGAPEHGPGGLTTSSARQHDREEDLQAAADKVGRLLFEAEILLRVTARPDQEEVALRTLRAMAGAFGQFSSPRLASFRPRKRGRGTFLLSTEEAATIWHPATSTVRTPTMTTVLSRELPPPVPLPMPSTHPELAMLGRITYRGRRDRFGILPEDRRRHMSIVGKTGMGKTTLLNHLILSDIQAGRGVALLDPHGDLCEALLEAIPRHRTNDVILFDAADRSHPLSFNVLHCPRPEQRPLVASGIVSAFKKLYGEFWGPRMEHILRNALLALLEVEGSTLLSVLRILTDVRFRQSVIGKVEDPVVRRFWQQEFAALPMKFQLEAVAPIQNKLGHFVSSPLLRNILGQTGSSLDLRAVLDRGDVLLVNLSKGKLGDDVSSLLGSFLVTAIQLAAMSRADVPEDGRSDFFLYVDEFQNFATESFATILSEARKYRLALTVANQYLGQLDEATAAALFGNVGTLISFQVGAADAEPLATQFGGELIPADLLQLPRYQAYIRLLIRGMPSRPFSMVTLPPGGAHDPKRPGIIRRTSRQRYARKVADVQREIAKAI